MGEAFIMSIEFGQFVQGEASDGFAARKRKFVPAKAIGAVGNAKEGAFDKKGRAAKARPG
jgi:hypothetical protein